MAVDIFNETPTGNADGSNCTFTLAYTPVLGSARVWLNEFRQEPSGIHYAISAKSIVFVLVPHVGDRIRADYQTNDIQGEISGVYDLVSLTELKLFPGLASAPSSDDSILLALIDAASLDFEKEWQSPGVQRSFTENYTYREIVSLRHPDTIWLRQMPVVSVTSITDPAGNTVDSDEYWIDKDVGALRSFSTGMVGLCGCWDIPVDANGYESYWIIVYTAGRVAATANVPANIKLACKMWVSMLYKDPTQNISSKSVGDLSITYKYRGPNDEGLPDQIRRMISCWKKVDA